VTEKSKKTDTSAEKLYNIIRRRILTEEYLPNEKLSIVALSEEFGCSRMPVRESLKLLERDGLIVIQPKSGSYVKDFNDQDNKNIMELRSFIEALSVKLILENDVDVKELRVIFDDLVQISSIFPVNFIAYGERHYDFHHKIVELSGNALCVQFFERLNLRSSMLFYQSMNSKTAKKTQNEHNKIVYLLEKRDPAIEKFMISHLWRKRNTITKHKKY
jgi:DNA-binding GntR family transcriptional regulator